MAGREGGEAARFQPQESSHQKKSMRIGLKVLMFTRIRSPLNLDFRTEVEEAVGGEGKPNPRKLPFPSLSNVGKFCEPAWFSHAFFHMTFTPHR